MFATVALFATVAAAQVTVTGSRQPIEVMRAVFGAELKKTALYQVVMCNDAAEQVDFAGGLAVQVMASHVPTIDGALVPAFASRARKRSKLWRATKAGEYLGLAGTVVLGAGTIAAPPAALIISALIASTSERLSGALGQEQAATAALLPRFLSADETLMLDPHRCASRLALGEYDKAMKGFSAVIWRSPPRASPATASSPSFFRPSWALHDVEFTPATTVLPETAMKPNPRKHDARDADSLPKSGGKI